MFEGGISFNKDSDKAIRNIALFATPIYAGYNMLVFAGIAPSNNYAGDLICLLISALWIIAGAYHFFSPIRSKQDMLLRLVSYQALSLATIVFITGFFQPFASSIALLFLASNIYFGRKALIASVSAVALTAVIDALIRYPSDPDILIYNSLGLGAILVLGVALIAVISSQETRRKELIKSQSQERLQFDRTSTIINNLTDATLSTDDKGTVLMYNAACLNLLDTNDNIKGKNISDLFNLTDADDGRVKLFDIMGASQKATVRDDLRHSYADGEAIRLELTFAPIKSNYSRSKKGQAQAGFVLIARDVTKQKSLEEERDEFISVVSHELRTPITIVEGTLSNLQLMMQHPERVDEKVLASTTTTAHDQVIYLAKMVNDLSTLSRAERGVADAAEDIDVSELIHRLHKTYEKDAAKRSLHLNLEMGGKLGSVKASRLYLEELLQNFITNAIKYTKEGSVTIIVKRVKDTVTFTVKDTGIGISRTDQAKVFHKFYRSEDYRIRETNGTGLGLYVSSKLAHKLGTNIELTSRINHGSSFSFSLPVTKAK